MGFLSSKKNKKQTRSECEIIPLYEREHSTYKVKQIFKVGHGKKDKEQRTLMLTEEGIKVMDLATGDLICTLMWRDMMWFEVRPATKEWVVHTKKTCRYEDKFRFVTSEALKIHAEAETYLDRFIRNYKLALHEAQKEPDMNCVQELIDEANSVNVGQQLSMAKAAALVGGAGM